MDHDELNMGLIAELLQEIENSPPGIESRKLMIEHYIAANAVDMAKGAIEELYSFRPRDTQVYSWYSAFIEDSPSHNNPVRLKTAQKAPRTSVFLTNFKNCYSKSSGSLGTRFQPKTNIYSQQLTSGNSPPPKEMEQLKEKFTAFRIRAQSLLRDMSLLENLKSGKRKESEDNHLSMLQALAEGKIVSVLKGKEPADYKTTPIPPKAIAPKSARSVTRSMKTQPKNAFEIVMADLEVTAAVPLQAGNKTSEEHIDEIRDILVKRVQVMSAALPDDMKMIPELALMHMEHEKLKKNYVNTETMFGDLVCDIPRENFYATEDGYAWDMDELQQAITAGQGVMRNPLSKHMFTPNDVKGILQHPLGKSLGALQVEQGQLRKGVRPQTIEELHRIAGILLEDMADDALKSRVAVDEFMAFVATLPDSEQKALDKLRVPAKDSHSGQAFDGSIGETLRDAKGNKLCFHKAGKSVILPK